MQMMAMTVAVAMLSSFGGCKGSGGGADSVTWYNIDIPSVKIAPVPTPPYWSASSLARGTTGTPSSRPD